MKASEKLQIVKDLSGLTQEKLANRLGVSFATLNSWVNERSLPRKKKEQLIDSLYKEYTGEKEVPENILQGKKDLILSESKKYKNIIRTIIGRPDLHEQYVLFLTYNSNKIEGSTLTEGETKSILFNNQSISNKSIIEHLEAKNHQTALNFLFKEINPSFKIEENFILKLHSILMNGIRDDAGRYRNHGVRILGANIPTANYLKVPQLMKDLIKRINKKEKDLIRQITQVHVDFEQIHPFSDGNGRIGRLLIQAMLLKNNIAPALIKETNKSLYLTYLNKAQRTNDTSLLEEFICDAILFWSFRMIEHYP